MSRTGVAAVVLLVLGIALTLGLNASAFTAPGALHTEAPCHLASQRFLASGTVSPSTASSSSSWSFGGVLAVAGIGACMLRAALAGRASTQAASSKAKYVSLSSSVAASPDATYVRDQLIACRAQLQEAGLPAVEEADKHMADLEAIAKRALGGAAAAFVFAGSMADAVIAYPIFAQQNYPNPREANGKLACANCHLASKPIDVRMPHDVLKDTIFKAAIEIPCKYEKRLQPIASGEKGPLNVGAIAIMPEGWKLAPKDRLPKALKKEMKGLAWAPYSKDKPNIVVAGPVPGQMYETMVLPILAPNPETQKDMYFGKLTMYFGGNRGRGQVYPEGNQSNNNQFFAATAGTVTAIDGLKVTIQKEDGATEVQEVLPGAELLVEVGDVLKKDEPITTNPNVGGFGQEEKEMMLQDMNRIYAYIALATSIFFAQLAFVLKKKQFEKVQLAEGF